MTQTENDRTVTVVATSDGQTVFAYDFQAFAATHVAGIFEDVSAGTRQDLVSASDFSVQNVGNPNGGTITLLTLGPSVSIGDRVTVFGEVPIDRTADYQQAGDFFAATVNQEEDTQTQIMQELRRDIDRAFKAQLGETVGEIEPGTEGRVLTYGAGQDIVPGPNADEISSAQASAVAAAASAVLAAQNAAALQSNTRAGLIALITGKTYTAGRIAYDGTAVYEYVPGSTEIADMPGWEPFGFISPSHYATNTTPGTTDMSAAINAAAARVNSLGGGLLHYLPGVHAGKELLIDSRVLMVGQGAGSTEIKLLDGANTYLMGCTSWVNNQTFVNTHIGATGIRFNGNKANNSSGGQVHMTCYRFVAKDCEFIEGAGGGLVLGTTTRDGSTTVSTNSNENLITHNSFDRNDGPGLHLEGNIADAEISWNRFNTNGGRNQASFLADRFAGSKFINNQVYNGGFDCVSITGLGRGVITGNHLDLEGTAAQSGDRIACIRVGSITDFSPSLITNNILYIGSTEDSSAIDMHGIALMANSDGTAIFGANAITDATTQKDATALYAVPAAANGLDNITWLPDALRDIDQGTPLRIQWTGIAERGSNANGEWVRFADGTLICKAVLTSAINATEATGSIFQTATEVSWTYPLAFVDANVAVRFNPRGDNSAWGKGRPSNSTTGLLRLFSATSLSAAQTIDVVAVGRWK